MTNASISMSRLWARLNISVSVLLWVLHADAVLGFSASPPTNSPRQFIHISDQSQLSAIENRLPISLVESWSTWMLHSHDDATRRRFEKIPDDDGFVAPASFDELWQPVDLKKPRVQLALGVHVRGGVIRQVMPVVDVCYPGGKHRNRGMCSLPRAHGWMEFSSNHDGFWDQYEIVLEERKQPQEGDDEKNSKWKELLSSSPGSIRDALERVVISLADSPPDELGVGSHFVHVALESRDLKDGEAGTVEIPTTAFEMRATMTNDPLISGREEAPGILQVTVPASMPGSESEFLPDVYKELFSDEEYQNDRYFEFIGRKDEQNTASSDSEPSS